MIPGTFIKLTHTGLERRPLEGYDEVWFEILRRYIAKLNGICETYAYCLLPEIRVFVLRIRPSQLPLARFRMEPGADCPSNNSHPNGLRRRIASCFSGSKGILSGCHGKHRVFEINGYDEVLKTIRETHLLPVHAGLCSHPEEWKASSYRIIAGTQPTFIAREKVLLMAGGMQNFSIMHACSSVENEQIEFNSMACDNGISNNQDIFPKMKIC